LGDVDAEQRQSIETVAMDMWEPYVQSRPCAFGRGGRQNIFDKFHIAKHLGEAVDKVRHRESKTLPAAGDDRLVGTRYDWLKHPAGMEPSDRREFSALRDSALKTALA
jgi:transposase